MKVLVFNCGSATVKFQLVEVAEGDVGLDRQGKVARGLVDRLGADAACVFSSMGGASLREAGAVADHEAAVRKIVAWVDGAGEAFGAVGHRVVHGGADFVAPVLIDDGVIDRIESFNELAPLHNPAALSGIRAMRKTLGAAVPMVAVFDTAFHSTIPDEAAFYAIPGELAKAHRIRRYGFHGLAHQYSALRYAELAGTPADAVNVITLHLGNGCSAAAIRAGRSIDTSMGFTPLEGLVMGTRSGDLDPALVRYLADKERVSAAEIETWLNQRSGLLGLSGLSNDMRELIAARADHPRARLAVDVFCYRARKYIGAYMAALGGAEAVVFSGGIGENSPQVRERICAGMEWCGIALDGPLNRAIDASDGCVSVPDSRVKVFVIHADEEALIARETAAVVRDGAAR